MEPSKNSSEKKVVILSDEERLRRDVFRPDMEKFRLFTQMLRNNKLISRAKITHK